MPFVFGYLSHILASLLCSFFSLKTWWQKRSCRHLDNSILFQMEGLLLCILLSEYNSPKVDTALIYKIT